MCLQVLRECKLACSMRLSPSVLTAAAGEESLSSFDSDDDTRADQNPEVEIASKEEVGSACNTSPAFCLSYGIYIFLVTLKDSSTSLCSPAGKI